MTGWFLPLLPDLLHWLPVISGGGGLAAGLLGLVPNLRTYALIGAAVVLAISVGGLLWYRGSYEAEVAGRIADRAAAQAEVLKAQQAAETLSNELIIQQAIAMGSTAKKASSLVQQIHAAPDADRMRLGSRGVHELILGGGSGPPSVGGAAAAVPGP
jgi:hypothetical protein